MTSGAKSSDGSLDAAADASSSSSSADGPAASVSGSSWTASLSSSSSSSSYASSSSSSYSYDPETVGNDPGWTKDFPCEFYPPDADGCAEYRSCYDCLNEGVVYKGRGCYINPNGRCQALATATFDTTKSLDFRKGNASNNATSPHSNPNQMPLYFPAGPGVKYCNATDPICKHCKKHELADAIDNQSNATNSSFCYGRNKCVCVAVCESPMRAELLGGLMCNGKPQYGPAGSSNQASSLENSSFLNTDANITWIVGVPMVGVLAAALFVSRRRKQRHLTQEIDDIFNFEGGARASSSVISSNSSESFSSSSSSEMSSSIDEDPHPTAASVAIADATISGGGGSGGRQLSLVGWHALRNELIGREQQMLSGGPRAFSAVGYVEFLDTSASAPSEDDSDDDSSDGDEDSDTHVMADGSVGSASVSTSSSQNSGSRTTRRGPRRRDSLFGIDLSDDEDESGVL
uniref:Uncharacterized protein n=1 Tax=Globisporangium ultimum (strain ATCC 200006 / CBS 805.95 / DAOM BR144) TaxID=431595 RepID=K3X0P3_GLOUD